MPPVRRRDRTSTDGSAGQYGRPTARAAGFALIVAIWISALLAALALALATAHRTRVRTVAHQVARAQAEAAAEGAIHLALSALARRQRQGERDWPALRLPPCRLSEGQVVQIDIADEAGKVDLNIAGEPLLRALLIGIGLEPDRAARVAAAIIDYRDADDEPGTRGAEIDDYRAAGRSSGPKNAAFETTRELAAVLGISADEARRLHPYITVASEQEGIDPTRAAASLAQILARGAPDVASSATGPVRIPPQWTVASTGRAVTIRSSATGRDGVTVYREALITLRPFRGRPVRPSVGSARTAPRQGPSLVPVIIEARAGSSAGREQQTFPDDALTGC